jgi:hypothetical protein
LLLIKNNILNKLEQDLKPKALRLDKLFLKLKKLKEKLFKNLNKNMNSIIMALSKD